MVTTKKFDWADAALALISSDATNLRQLVSAAELDAHAGDLSDVDFSNIDLTGQDLSGWDFDGTPASKAPHSPGQSYGVPLSIPFPIIEAVGWESAKLDDDVRGAAHKAALLVKSVDELELSIRSANVLRSAGIEHIGDVVSYGEAGLLRLPNFGRKSLNEIKEILASLGLHVGMDIKGWPPERLAKPPTQLLGDSSDFAVPQRTAEGS